MAPAAVPAAGRRDPMEAPVRKLSVNLIKTYKYINHVYYENKRRRQAQQQQQQAQQQQQQQQQQGPATDASNTANGATAKRKSAGGSTGASSSSVAKSSAGGKVYNNGYDDENSDYLIRIGERIRDRYVVKQKIGKGSFGQVVRAYDDVKGENVAVKIIKSRKPFFLQAKTEIALLQELNMKDSDDKWFVVRLLDTFVHHNHQCLVFEMLSFNLYDLLRNTNFDGVSLNLIRKFARQILKALHFLAREDIDVIHCDLKPENILLRHPKRSAIKVIDFGSSCKSDRQMYQYIQSRFYRSPEVILGRPYSVAIDMWSLGCILVEMHTGEPLFSGTDEHDQMIRLVAVRGMPPEEILDGSTKTHKFFEPNTAPDTCHEVFRNSKWKLKPHKNRSRSVDSELDQHQRSLRSILGMDGNNGPASRRKGEPGHSDEMYGIFIDLVERMLDYDPSTRITPKDALSHPFILSDRVTPTGGSGASATGAHASQSQQQAQQQHNHHHQAPHLQSNQTASPIQNEQVNIGSQAARNPVQQLQQLQQQQIKHQQHQQQRHQPSYAGGASSDTHQHSNKQTMQPSNTSSVQQQTAGNRHSRPRRRSSYTKRPGSAPAASSGGNQVSLRRSTRVAKQNRPVPQQQQQQQ